ncbi:MAG TPA: polyprenyl synthetase family protein [Tangfeifania sp.]|nr:polyprenyl synthetase family protein [Tangfeifania sp.]
MYSIEALQKKVNHEIDVWSETLSKKEPHQLYAPVKYALSMGGKRLRPVLLLMSANIFRDDIESGLPAALAVEIFHNFTLLHDDIMDKAEVRRNKPTVHKHFSENTAILSGDAMAFLSYQLLLKCRCEKLSEITRLFTETALEVCEGQQYDMDFENRQDVTEAKYLEMIRLKTAVLLACSLKAGAQLADAENETAKLMYDFGINLGLAFQLQDDLLDTFGNQESFGKKIGGDIVANKKTYLLINALEKANSEQKQELKKWLAKTGFDANEKINAVTNLYNQLGIKKLTEEKIDSYFNAASEILQKLPVDEKRKLPLKNLSKMMLGRNS